LQRGKVEIDLAETAGDFTVRRRDGIPAYQIASLTDDVHFGITHIVRGEDLLPSTAAQLFLAEKLGLTSFLQSKFLHHALITDESGQKLSKSNLSQQH
jgi:glutamyl/glutaminyl-tRNA synthetase